MQPSKAIRPRQTREIKRAARHAWRVGRELTRYVVINFPNPPEGDELAPQRAFMEIRRKCRSWWDYKRKKDPTIGPLTDIKIWENKNGIIHMNWLVRIPDDLVDEFSVKREKWIEKVIPGQPDGTVKDEAIYNLNGVLNYVLKGTEPNKAATFGIRPSDQGVIWGRRATASINLGRSARDRDWQDGSVVQKAWKYRKPSPHAT